MPDLQDLAQSPGERESVTELLRRWSQGDGQALDALVPVIIWRVEDHRSTVSAQRASGDAALHRLVDQTHVGWNVRAHFFGAAANVMRRILVDRARHRKAAKRGGEVPVPEDLAGVTVAVDADLDVIDLHDALAECESIDPESARTLELRYCGPFGGRDGDRDEHLTGDGQTAVVARPCLALQKAQGRGAAGLDAALAGAGLLGWKRRRSLS